MKTKQRFASVLLKKLPGIKVFSAVCMLFLLLGAGPVSAQNDQMKVSKEQQQKLDLMKSKSVEASLTILPVRFMGSPFDRISEVVGVLMEEQGLRNIELLSTAFDPEGTKDVSKLAEKVGVFVKGQPIKTDYVLYAEMNGSKEKRAIEELLGIVVDKAGSVVWTDRLTSGDEIFRQVEDPDPMGFSVLLTQRLCPQMGLNEETAKNAKPGKMAALMDERSGLPPESERALLPERQKLLKENIKTSTLLVCPVRVNGEANEVAAGVIVKMLNEAGAGKAMVSKDKVLMKSRSEDPNEMKKLWDLAREFRDYVRKNPMDADYMLYADYEMPAYVHFVVCDRKGEWVITDLQNSAHPDFRAFFTATVDGCSHLVAARFLKYLKSSVSDEVRKSINDSGIEAGKVKFKEAAADKKTFYLSEDEMNALGYEYLMSNKVKEAIAVFQLNVDAFPESWNVYDSLGEAYAAAGEKDIAIQNYEKSLQLNPESPSGKQALKKLKAK